MKDCIYKGICQNECGSSCYRYSEMKYLLDTSNIPKSQQCIHRLKPDDCDVPAFEKLAEIQMNIEEFTNNGGILYIYSDTCGNGKTTWTIKLMLQYFNEVWAGNGFECRGIFINVPTFLTMSKQVINLPNPEFEKMRAKLGIVDLVAFDDVTATKFSNYDYTTLLAYIDQRIFNNKATIFTGNIKPENLYDVLGDRLASRICQGTNIQLRGLDNRWSNYNS